MPHAQKILRFKLGSGKKDTVIVFEQVTENDDRIEAELEVKEEVHPDLVELLDSYLEMAIGLAKNDMDAWCHGFVGGVSFKHGGDGIGAVFSIQLKDEDGPICDNTPYRGPDYYDQVRLMQLHNEIVQCVNGKRFYEQQTLALDTAEPAKAAPKNKRRGKGKTVATIDGNALTPAAKRAKAIMNDEVA